MRDFFNMPAMSCTIMLAKFRGFFRRPKKLEGRRNNEIRKFELSVTYELNTFKRQLKKLLWPYVRNPRQAERLINDVHDDAWRDKTLKESLKAHFGPNSQYFWFFTILEGFRLVLKEMHLKMGNRDEVRTTLSRYFVPLLVSNRNFSSHFQKLFMQSLMGKVDPKTFYKKLYPYDQDDIIMDLHEWNDLLRSLLAEPKVKAYAPNSQRRPGKNSFEKDVLAYASDF